MPAALPPDVSPYCTPMPAAPPPYVSPYCTPMPAAPPPDASPYCTALPPDVSPYCTPMPAAPPPDSSPYCTHLPAEPQVPIPMIAAAAPGRLAADVSPNFQPDDAAVPETLTIMTPDAWPCSAQVPDTAPQLSPNAVPSTPDGLTHHTAVPGKQSGDDAVPRTSAVNATHSTLSPAVQSSPNTSLPFIDKVRQLSCSFQCIVSDSTKVTFAQFYYGGIMNIKWTVSCFGNGNVKVHVHGTEICRNHELWDGLPEQFVDVQQVCDLMSRLASYDVCVGNPDADLICLAEPMLNVEHSGYHKENWQAVAGNLSYNATVRGSKCAKLFRGVRCHDCRQARNRLRAKRARKLSCDSNGSSKRKANSLLTVEEKDVKLRQLANSTKNLQRKVKKLRDKVDMLEERGKALILQKGENLGSIDCSEMLQLMKDCEPEIEKAFSPDSFQHIFFKQQARYNSLKNKASMRWHPAIIRLCLYLRSKSGKAYDGIRQCLALPSQRTLFDYTNYTESGTGFQVRVTEQLIKQAQKKGLYNEESKKYVGIIQDEVRIKSDLVYNKHTGELVGYINLDDIGNELLNLEHELAGTAQAVAKFMLVVMVRGVCSNLQYPLAAFPTEGITSDFLYPIIWEAIEVVQVTAGLQVLFITCDGASANRKFFTLHSDQRDRGIYRLVNPYFGTNDHIYFISDVPHLLKTSRNCFANSYAHKRSRSMWNQGTISWQDLVRLFEDYCRGAYRLCPKLTPGHVYLTSFSRMKVNLAAQVLSGTVANALEFTYGDQMAPTVNFIRMMDRWFDMMNSRNLSEAHQKRNPDIAAFSREDDPRLDWLVNVFLPYFDDWTASINARFQHLPAAERARKQLSQQTLTGLLITTKSIVECVRFLLGKGPAFVLTEHFNQDALERHFGHYRQKGGANENPTVFEVCHIINQVRAVSTSGFAPRRGNVRGDIFNVVDNAPLPRRRQPPNWDETLHTENLKLS